MKGLRLEQVLVGEQRTVLVGGLINCESHSVAVTGAAVTKTTGGVSVTDFLVGPLDGRQGFDHLDGHGATVPSSLDETRVGLFATIPADSLGPFEITSVAVRTDEQGRERRHVFTTHITGRVEE